MIHLSKSVPLLRRALLNTLVSLTTLWREGEGEGTGVIGTGTRSPSIMVKTFSGMSVASLHWSCQLLSFDVRMSLACAVAREAGEKMFQKEKLGLFFSPTRSECITKTSIAMAT